MSYNKSVNWYVTSELKPLAKKLEAYINKRGTPKVKVRVRKSVIFIDAPIYAAFQDQGVKGKNGGRSLSGFKYKDKAPPSNVFARYTDDLNHQYNIAQKIYRDGIKPKLYIKKSIGHFAPQTKRAIDSAIKNYTDIEVFKL